MENNEHEQFVLNDATKKNNTFLQSSTYSGCSSLAPPIHTEVIRSVQPGLVAEYGSQSEPEVIYIYQPWDTRLETGHVHWF